MSTDTGSFQALKFFQEKLQQDVFLLHHALFGSEQGTASWQTVCEDYLFICTMAHHIYGENWVEGMSPFKETDENPGRIL